MYIYWLVVDLTPCKIWVRQIGSSQLLRKIKFMFQTTNIPPTSKFCGWKWLNRVAIHRDGPHNTINSSNHMCSTQKTSVIIHLRWWINSILFRLNINWTLRPEASGTSWDDETEIWRNSSWRAFVRSDYPTHPDSVSARLRFRFSKFGMQLMMAEWATQPAKHDKKQLTRRPAVSAAARWHHTIHLKKNRCHDFHSQNTKILSHMLHAWYIYVHLSDFDGIHISYMEHLALCWGNRCQKPQDEPWFLGPQTMSSCSRSCPSLGRPWKSPKTTDFGAFLM